MGANAGAEGTNGATLNVGMGIDSLGGVGDGARGEVLGCRMSWNMQVWGCDLPARAAPVVGALCHPSIQTV